jgi:integrase
MERRAVPVIRQVPAEKHKARSTRLLSRAEQAQLLNVVEHANEARAYALFTLMLDTGIRISEVRRLIWSDVKIEGTSGTIRIRSSKSRREVIMSLGAMTADALCALRESGEFKAETPVIPGRSGPLTRSQIVNVLSRYFSAAGIRHWKPEMLRATFEANMIDKGIDPYMLAYLMGYSRLGFPLKRYSEIREVLDRDPNRRRRVCDDGRWLA